MIIKIKATEIELTEPLKIWIEEKVGELKRKLVSEEEERKKGREKINVEVEVGRITRHHKKGEVYRSEIQVYLPQKLLRSVSSNIDLRTAIIEARDGLDREIRKYKGKKIARARKWARRAKIRMRTPKFLRKGRRK